MSVTLKSLFDMSEREVSSHKGESKREHDARCSKMFTREFGQDREARLLSRREWDRFIIARRTGRLSPRGNAMARPVRDRVIAYDLKYLLAVLNWACTIGNGQGGALLDRNPLKGLPIPTEVSPRRSVIVAEQFRKLCKAARKIGASVELLLVLCDETGHRVGAIRQLRWSDIDLRVQRVTWRAEHDKIGREHVTQLSGVAVAALSKMRQTDRAIGDAWVFRSRKDPGRPWSRHYVRDLWDRLAKATNLPGGQRYGWHALRRKFASELKGIPLKDLCELGGWRSPQTILTCYQKGDEATQRTALAQRKTLTASGLTG